MFVTSKGIIDGVIGDRFGGHGTQFNDHGMPTYSLPFKIEDLRTRCPSRSRKHPRKRYRLPWFWKIRTLIL